VVELEALRPVGRRERELRIVTAQLGDGGASLGDRRPQLAQSRVGDSPRDESSGNLRPPVSIRIVARTGRGSRPDLPNRLEPGERGQLIIGRSLRFFDGSIHLR
jgi:hypothetical protein